MATRNEQKWQANFNKLKAYIEEHGQLPDKKKEPDRNLLNWWKYNKRLIKQGKMDAERYVKLMMLVTCAPATCKRCRQRPAISQSKNPNQEVHSSTVWGSCLYIYIIKEWVSASAPCGPV